MEPAITLCVVEDHPMLREGLAVTLSRDGFTVLGCAATADDGFDMIVRRRPRVAIVDLLLGEDRGDELVNLIRAATPEIGVVLFTGAESPADLEPALTCGAHAIVSKSAPPEELRAALRMAAVGDGYLDERIRRLLAAAPDVRRGERILTGREREVLGMLAQGMTLDQSAQLLDLSAETVRTHARNAGRRLGGRSRVHTIALALRTGEI